MSRYKNVVIPRREPFVKNVTRAKELVVELAVLRERFFRIGMIQTFHALEVGEQKAGWELADHLGLAGAAPEGPPK